MAKSDGKTLTKKLEELGYEFDRINSSARHVYVREGFPDVPVNLKISEREARFLIKRLERQHGIEQDSNKRNARAVKERHRAERERIKSDLERLDAERSEILRRKQELPVGDLDGLGHDERRSLERELERIDGERRAYERLMTELSAPLANAASHTAGER